MERRTETHIRDDVNSDTRLREGTSLSARTLSSGCTTLPNLNLIHSRTSLRQQVFVTSKTYALSFGGVVGADKQCATLASAAGLLGTFKAWISDSTTSPAASFAPSSAPDKQVDGTVIANDWADLIDGALAIGINLDENGTTEVKDVITTATKTSGFYTGSSCSNWTSATKGGFTRGVSTRVDGTWTDDRVDNCTKLTQVRFYCFEQ